LKCYMKEEKENDDRAGKKVIKESQGI
jgi:hypothetical protein